ncbi:MAG: acylneuraminate cytidylyltransferase family protein [Pseudomonadota bacterium]
MIGDKRVLAIVPARGGSKGIRLKNLRMIGDHSLVARAGLLAGKVPAIDRAVVSTDHEDIAAAAEAVGLAAPFRRPEALSGDRIADWDVLHHALLAMEELDGVTYDIILMLQPTSPGRTRAHVEATLERLVDQNFDAVWTVSETDSKGHPLKQLLVEDDHGMDYYDPAGSKIIARQQLKPVYHRNGIAYAMTRNCLLEQKTIKGARTGAYVVKEIVPNIDTELDIQWAEFLFERNVDPLNT